MSRVEVRGLAAAAVVAAGIAGVAGGAAGAYAVRGVPAQAGVAVVAPPSPDEVRAATQDLCSRYVVGYRAMADHPAGVADVLPRLSYNMAALADNPGADGEIRAAVAESLRMDRGQAAYLGKVEAAGAIQPPAQWRGKQANEAADHVLGLCRAYGG